MHKTDPQYLAFAVSKVLLFFSASVTATLSVAKQQTQDLDNN